MEPICMKDAVPSIKEGHRGSSTGGCPTVDVCNFSMTVLEIVVYGVGRKREKYPLW
jgi:hypothetical protein